MVDIVEIKCIKCGYDSIPSQVELHHLVPKAIEGNDSYGRRYLCKKCHNIVHNMLLKQVFKKFVPEDKKEVCRGYVKTFTLWWIGKHG